MIGLFPAMLLGHLLCGDVTGDGTLTLADAYAIAQYDVHAVGCGGDGFLEPRVCDVNRDGACDIGDALAVAQCVDGFRSCNFHCRPFRGCR